MRVVHIEILVSGVLLILTWLGSQLLHIPILDRIAVSVSPVVAGVAGGLLLASFIPLYSTAWARRVVVLRDLSDVCDSILIPLAASLRRRDIVLLAIMSGVSEELFFRGILQPAVGLLPASVAFGLLHWVRPAYAGWASAVGVLLGLAYRTSGNLVVPILMHATHNFVALMYLRRCRPR